MTPTLMALTFLLPLCPRYPAWIMMAACRWSASVYSLSGRGVCSSGAVDPSADVWCQGHMWVRATEGQRVGNKHLMVQMYVQTTTTIRMTTGGVLAAKIQQVVGCEQLLLGSNRQSSFVANASPPTRTRFVRAWSFPYP